MLNLKVANHVFKNIQNLKQSANKVKIILPPENSSTNEIQCGKTFLLKHILDYDSICIKTLLTYSSTSSSSTHY